MTMPFRGQKGRVYEGGVRVPGVIEWPAGIPEPRASDVNSVTSDMLPTLCELAGEPAPQRPLDGISLKPLIEGAMNERPTPIGFWNFVPSNEDESRPYIDPSQQEGTTNLAKMMDGKFTRTFTNFHHPEIREEDYRGPRALLDNRYKLVVHDQDDGEPLRELFDLENDIAEEKNLIDEQPEVAERMERQLREWQESVLTSLTGGGLYDRLESLLEDERQKVNPCSSAYYGDGDTLLAISVPTAPNFSLGAVNTVFKRSR